MTISYQNIPNNLLVPLFYAEIDNSRASTFAQNNKSLIIGQRLVLSNTAQAPNNEPVIVASGQQAGELFGYGSILERMVSIYKLNHPFSELWVLPLADPTGATPAETTINITGTATENAKFTLGIGGQNIDIVIENGKTAEQVVNLITNTVNSTPSCVAIASATANSVLLISKNKGEISNDILIQLNPEGLASKQKVPAGLTIKFNGTDNHQNEPMMGGAGTIDLTTLAADLGTVEFDFIISPYTDTASLSAYRVLMNDVSGRWSWLNQIYGHVFSASRGLLAEITTKVSLINDQHLTVTAIETTCPNPVWEVATAFAARSADFLEDDPARPTQTGQLIGIKAPKSGLEFTKIERQTLLTNGAAIIYYINNQAFIERGITTYLKNPLGVLDTSYRDSETLYTTAYVLRYLRSVISTKFARHKLANDGTNFGAGQAVVTPNIIKSEILATYNQLERQGLVENFDAFKTNLVVERDDNDPNRVNVLFPPDYINQLRVFATLAQFRLQY